MQGISKLASIEVDFKHVGTQLIPLFLSTSNQSSSIGRAAIVYGKNGAGKSSLARALKEPTSGFRAFDRDNRPLDLQDASDIHVFDESFINENVRQVGHEKLNPVILLGEQVDHQEEIEEKEKTLSQLNNSHRNIEKKVSNRNKALENAKTRLTQSLKGSSDSEEGSWANRAFALHGKKKKITDTVRKAVIELGKPDTSLEAVASEFEQAKTKLSQSESREVDNYSGPQFIPSLDIAGARHAIEKIDSRTDSSSDDELKTRIQTMSKGLEDLRHKFNDLFSQQADCCPTCFQDIPQTHKDKVRPLLQNLIDEIELDSEVQALTNFEAVWDAKIPLPKIASVPLELQDKASNASQNLENLKSQFNAALKQKIDNPRAKVELRAEGFEGAVKDWQSAIKELNNCVTDHNSAITTRTQILRHADELNLKMAAIEASAEIAKFSAATDNFEKESTELSNIQTEIEDLKAAIKDLRHNSSEEATGAEQINELLKVVFGRNGIQLRPSDHGYIVINREKKMSPEYLSTGERNALALSYFFVQIAEGEEFEDGLKKSHLVVLDDPISSFDLDNRYGVTALIGFMTRQMLCTPNGSKLLFLTHDPSVAYDLSKILNANLSGSELTWEFSEGKITHKNFAASDVYEDILRRMFWATADKGVCEKLTANEVRRVWEAFVTFELGEKTTDASTSAKVRKYFEDMGERQKKFLEFYPGRVFINPDSHAASQLSYFNFGLQPSLELDEFQRFIGETLCFMHMLSPYHISSRISHKSAERIEIKNMLDKRVENLLELEEINL